MKAFKNVALSFFFFTIACSTPTSKLGQTAADPQTSVENRKVSSNDPSPLLRRYKTGGHLKYRIKMVHTIDGKITSTYDAHTEGVVKLDSKNVFYEEFQWIKLNDDGKNVALSQKSQDFRQMLSLSPEFTLGIPTDLPNLNPELIGPVTDLLTFYVDDYIAIRQPTIRKAGDHIYLKTSSMSSWGAGQDCLDFDVTLLDLDGNKGIATLRVNHVPPSKMCIKPPVTWMNSQIADTPNNWFEVTKPGKKWIADVGKETFEVVLKIDLPSGVIRSATMDNPVVMESRDCDDEQLSTCGTPAKHLLKRKLIFEAE